MANPAFGTKSKYPKQYKEYDAIYGVKREDLFQLHTYVGQYSNRKPIGGCGFIYPITQNKWDAYNLSEKSGVISDLLIQQENSIPFHVVFLKVPEANSTNFNKSMNLNCRELFENFNDRIIIN